MKIRKVLAILLTLVMTLSLVACGGDTKEEAPKAEDPKVEEPKNEEPAATGDNTIKIGLVFPTSGGSASAGQLNIWGITDYFEYYNEKGGIQSLGGAEIVWDIRDSEGAADIAVTAAEALIGDDSVSALLGTYNSGTMSAVAPVVAKYDMPMVGVNSIGSYCYTTENECIVHVCNLDQQDAPIMVDFYKTLKEKHGLESAFLVLDNSELSTNNRVLLADCLEKAGVPMAGEEVFNVGASDFSTIAQKIKAANPGFILAQMGPQDAVLFTQTLNEYDINVPVQGMGAGFVDPTYLEAVGDMNDGTIASAYYFASALDGALDPEWAHEINDNCIAEHGVEINEPYAIGWTAAAVLVDALERAASTDRAAIAKALMETKIPADHEANLFFNYSEITFEDFECANGDYVYNQNPNAVVMYAQYQDGEYKVIYPANSAVAELKVG